MLCRRVLCLVLSDEKLCDLVALAHGLYRLLVSDGGGVELADLECLLVDKLDSSRSVHSLHPAHALCPLMEVREFVGLALGSVVRPVQLASEV